MAELPLEVTLDGDDAEYHELPAYDGFSSLAGLALATTMITHYAATGRLRRRGQFEARSQVRLTEVRRGSIVFGLIIHFASTNPFVLGITGGVISAAVYDLLKVVIKKNIGQEFSPATDAVQNLLARREGDIEALAVATEPSLRQAHSIIGNGAQVLSIAARADAISTFDADTKEYISKSVEDTTIMEKDFSVASFNANSGHGRVFDEDIGRTVSFYIPEHAQNELRAVLGWGLNEYSKGTGQRVSVKYTRVLAVDGRPKKYIVVDASIPQR